MRRVWPEKKIEIVFSKKPLFFYCFHYTRQFFFEFGTRAQNCTVAEENLIKVYNIKWLEWSFYVKSRFFLKETLVMHLFEKIFPSKKILCDSFMHSQWFKNLKKIKKKKLKTSFWNILKIDWNFGWFDKLLNIIYNMKRTFFNSKYKF